MRISKKRILSVLAATALSISAVPQNAVPLKPVLTACAEADVSENFTYNISDDGEYVIITKCISSDTAVEVPEEIEGLPVKEIGSWSFFDCDGVESVVLPSTIKTIGSNAFNGCDAMTEVVLKEGIESIGDGAFINCHKLKEVTLPESVTSIGVSAFSGCKELENVVIHENVTSIGSSAFRDTAWLRAKSADDPLVVVNNILIDGTASSGKVTIPNNVTVICGMAFSSCRAMTDISIPAGVKSIGESAFYNCSGLKNVSIDDGVESIGYQAFSNCTELTEIVIPDSVTTINGSTFFGCTKLAAVKLPSGLTSITNSMFSGCTALTGIDIPDSVKQIEMRAFLSCSSLEEVVIPEGTESIAMQAFALCRNMKSITIPDSVTSIGQMAFTSCPDLTIIGNAGSDAATYAQNNGIAYDAFNSVSLTLSDDLGLNFYVSGIDTAEAAAAYRVTFSGECEENGETVSLKKKKEGYCATANISADHMGEEITAVLERKYDEDWKKISEQTYSVNRYLDSVDTTGSEALAELVTATKEYGQVTDAYFNGGTVTAITDEQVNEVIANTYDSTFTTDEAKLSLVLDSKLAARIYIKDKAVEAGASAEYTQYSSDTSPWYDITAKAGGKAGVYFEIPGLAPTELHVPYRVKYDGKYYNFSPLTWARRVMKNPDSTDKSKAMAYALYKYYVTARDFKYADEA
ncbi:MAG: leucine-rich repeat domain-containing protein [Ruminococcus sp.]|nr:leucine-rich repeat domain-containing protein [Ruminococcus sp.]